MSQPALMAEDGAKFFGGVNEVEPGVYRAHCYAQLDSGGHIDIESPDYEMFENYNAGKAWIHARAARRGFMTWVRSAD